jgi:hypothetical protein
MSTKTTTKAVSGFQSTTARSSVVHRSVAAVVGFVVCIAGIFAAAPGLAGTTRPSANKVLRAAETAGLIAMSRGEIRLLDIAALRRRAR